jgi:hypothetical protein
MGAIMKKVLIVLLFLILCIHSVCFASTATSRKVILKNSDGTYSIFAYNGSNATIDKDGAGAVAVLDADSLNTANLSLIDEITFSNDVVTLLEASSFSTFASYLSIQRSTQSETIADEGTLTPDVSDDLTISITGSSDPTNITLVENGSEETMDKITIINVSENPIVFIDQSTVLELDGDCQLPQGGTLTAIWVNGAYYEIGRSGAAEYFGSINLSPTGTIQGAEKIIEASGTVTSNNIQMGATYIFTASGSLEIAANLCATATGANVTAMITDSSYVVDIYSTDGSDNHYLADGTALSGNAIRVTGGTGDETCVICRRANQWWARDYQGTSADAGGAGASCTLYDYFTGTVDSGTAVGAYNTYAYAGTIITPDSEIDVCEFTYNIRSIEGDISSGGSHKDIYLEIYNLSSGDLTGSPLKTSNELDGDDAASGDYKFTFATAQTLSAGTSYGFAVKVCSNGSTTAQADENNYIKLGYDLGSNIGDMVGGLVATGGRQRWNTSLTNTTDSTTDDLKVEIYTE